MNLDRQIARRSQDLVRSQRKTQFTEQESEYRSLCESFPVLLRTAGLLQSAVFLRAKGKHPHQTLFQHLDEQLSSLEFVEKGKLIDVLADPERLPAQEYRMLTEVCDRVAYWHKRMSQAYLRTKKEGAA